jgi:hypothetical protein
MNKLISSLLASETPSSSGRVIKIAGATTNDRSNQNEHIQNHASIYCNCITFL